MGGSEDLYLAKKAIQADDRDAARAHLFRAIGADPWDERAWLWLSTVIDDPARQRECLERALRIGHDHHPERPRASVSNTASAVIAGIERWLQVGKMRRLILLGGLLALLGIMALALAGVGREDIATARQVRGRCEGYVLGELVAPSTAEFSSSSDTAIGRTSDPGQTWIVAGHVDAQNKYSAMLRMRYVCKVRYRGEGGWELLELYVQEP
jgi:hypothetical protein